MAQVETSVPEPPLPPPPPPPPTGDVQPDAGPQVGQLTTGWRITVLATWVLVFLAYTAVWKASRELGLATWWLGPTAEPRPFPVLLVPFVAPLAMIIATINNSRRLPWYGLAAAAVGVAIAIGDLGTFRRLGLVELGIAVAAAAVSVASMAGQYRAAATSSSSTDLSGGRAPLRSGGSELGR